MKRKSGALSLERFAKAKQTGFDKRAKIQKELALKAKQVNKYRKLRQKLAKQGVLAPRVNYKAQEEEGDPFDDRPAQPRREAPQMERIQARAGPAPDFAGESDDDEMLGDVSEGDSGDEPIASAGHGRQQQPQVQQQPKGSHDARGAHQGPHQRNAIAKAAAGEQEVLHTARADASAAAGDAVHGTSNREGHKEDGTEAGYEHGRGHKEEGPLGRKQKRGKKRKPESQLQRMQAQVQAKKEADQREREERRRRIEEHERKVAEAERRRKQQTKMLRKRNHQGQPVMRYRMDKILSQLQAEAGQL